MIRTFALTATILLSHALATSIQAQTTPYDDRGFDPTGSGISNYGTLPNGSFGFGYTQLIPAGSLVVDQYYMVHAAPTVAPEPRAVAAQPAPITRVSRSTSNRTRATPLYQLPTGSLSWYGANGVILYSPAARSGAYGAGYGRGPYGVVNYGYMYKGWPMGY